MISCAIWGKLETTHGTLHAGIFPSAQETQRVLGDQNKVTGPTRMLVKRVPRAGAGGRIALAGPKLSRVGRGRGWPVVFHCSELMRMAKAQRPLANRFSIVTNDSWSGLVQHGLLGT